MFPPSAWIFLLSWGVTTVYVLLVFVIVWRFNRTGTSERGQTEDLDVWSRRPSENVKVLIYVVSGKPIDPVLRWLTTTARVCLLSAPILFILALAVAFIPPILRANVP